MFRHAAFVFLSSEKIKPTFHEDVRHPRPGSARSSPDIEPILFARNRA